MNADFTPQKQFKDNPFQLIFFSDFVFEFIHLFYVFENFVKLPTVDPY
ncbi:MAG: hypothetical protein ABI045_04745 [Flavobacteriales bacterium]